MSPRDRLLHPRFKLLILSDQRRMTLFRQTISPSKYCKADIKPPSFISSWCKAALTQFALLKAQIIIANNSDLTHTHTHIYIYWCILLQILQCAGWRNWEVYKQMAWKKRVGPTTKKFFLRYAPNLPFTIEITEIWLCQYVSPLYLSFLFSVPLLG